MAKGRARNPRHCEQPHNQNRNQKTQANLRFFLVSSLLFLAFPLLPFEGGDLGEALATAGLVRVLGELT